MNNKLTRAPEITILKQIARNIGKNCKLLPPKPITGFMAMVGKAYEHELMVVGRAVNGWTSEWYPESLNEDRNVHAFTEGIFESVTKGTPCPMSWVSECWGNDQDYNTRRSPFWRVIRRINRDRYYLY